MINFKVDLDCVGIEEDSLNITTEFSLYSQINYVQGKGSEYKSFLVKQILNKPYKSKDFKGDMIYIFCVEVLSDFIENLNDGLYMGITGKIVLMVDEEITKVNKDNFKRNFRTLCEIMEINRDIYYLQFVREKTNISVQQEYMCVIDLVVNTKKAKYFCINSVSRSKSKINNLESVKKSLVILEDKGTGYDILSTKLYNINQDLTIIPSFQGNAGIEKLLSSLSELDILEKFNQIFIVYDGIMIGSIYNKINSLNIENLSYIDIISFEAMILKSRHFKDSKIKHEINLNSIYLDKIVYELRDMSLYQNTKFTVEEKLEFLNFLKIIDSTELPLNYKPEEVREIMIEKYLKLFNQNNFLSIRGFVTKYNEVFKSNKVVINMKYF